MTLKTDIDATSPYQEFGLRLERASGFADVLRQHMADAGDFSTGYTVLTALSDELQSIEDLRREYPDFSSAMPLEQIQNLHHHAQAVEGSAKALCRDETRRSLGEESLTSFERDSLYFSIRLLASTLGNDLMTYANQVGYDEQTVNHRDDREFESMTTEQVPEAVLPFLAVLNDLSAAELSSLRDLIKKHRSAEGALAHS